MEQSARVLMLKYPGEFTLPDLKNHIDDPIHRFENRALGDSVYRVGCVLHRKLHRNDRILSPVIDGMNAGCPVDYLLRTFACGLCFRATDESGHMFPVDVEFVKTINDKGLNYLLVNLCGLSPVKDRELIDRICSTPLSSPFNKNLSIYPLTLKI